MVSKVEKAQNKKDKRLTTAPSFWTGGLKPSTSDEDEKRRRKQQQHQHERAANQKAHGAPSSWSQPTNGHGQVKKNIPAPQRLGVPSASSRATSPHKPDDASSSSSDSRSKRMTTYNSFWTKSLFSSSRENPKFDLVQHSRAQAPLTNGSSSQQQSKGKQPTGAEKKSDAGRPLGNSTAISSGGRVPELRPAPEPQRSFGKGPMPEPYNQNGPGRSGHDDTATRGRRVEPETFAQHSRSHTLSTSPLRQHPSTPTDPLGISRGHRAYSSEDKGKAVPIMANNVETNNANSRTTGGLFGLGRQVTPVPSNQNRPEQDLGRKSAAGSAASSSRNPLASPKTQPSLEKDSVEYGTADTLLILKSKNLRGVEPQTDGESRPLASKKGKEPMLPTTSLNQRSDAKAQPINHIRYPSQSLMQQDLKNGAAGRSAERDDLSLGKDRVPNPSEMAAFKTDIPKTYSPDKRLPEASNHFLDPRTGYLVSTSSSQPSAVKSQQSQARAEKKDQQPKHPNLQPQAYSGPFHTEAQSVQRPGDRKVEAAHGLQPKDEKARDKANPATDARPATSYKAYQPPQRPSRPPAETSRAIAEFARASPASDLQQTGALKQQADNRGPVRLEPRGKNIATGSSSPSQDKVVSNGTTGNNGERRGQLDQFRSDPQRHGDLSRDERKPQDDQGKSVGTKQADAIQPSRVKTQKLIVEGSASHGHFNGQSVKSDIRQNGKSAEAVVPPATGANLPQGRSPRDEASNPLSKLLGNKQQPGRREEPRKTGVNGDNRVRVENAQGHHIPASNSASNSNSKAEPEPKLEKVNIPEVVVFAPDASVHQRKESLSLFPDSSRAPNKSTPDSVESSKRPTTASSARAPSYTHKADQTSRHEEQARGSPPHPEGGNGSTRQTRDGRFDRETPVPSGGNPHSQPRSGRAETLKPTTGAHLMIIVSDADREEEPRVIDKVKGWTSTSQRPVPATTASRQDINVLSDHDQAHEKRKDPVLVASEASRSRDVTTMQSKNLTFLEHSLRQLSAEKFGTQPEEGRSTPPSNKPSRRDEGRATTPQAKIQAQAVQQFNVTRNGQSKASAEPQPAKDPQTRQSTAEEDEWPRPPLAPALQPGRGKFQERWSVNDEIKFEEPETKNPVAQSKTGPDTMANGAKAGLRDWLQWGKKGKSAQPRPQAPMDKMPPYTSKSRDPSTGAGEDHEEPTRIGFVDSRQLGENEVVAQGASSSSREAVTVANATSFSHVFEPGSSSARSVSRSHQKSETMEGFPEPPLRDEKAIRAAQRPGQGLGIHTTKSKAQQTVAPALAESHPSRDMETPQKERSPAIDQEDFMKRMSQGINFRLVPSIDEPAETPSMDSKRKSRNRNFSVHAPQLGPSMPAMPTIPSKFDTDKQSQWIPSGTNPPSRDIPEITVQDDGAWDKEFRDQQPSKPRKPAPVDLDLSEFKSPALGAKGHNETTAERVIDSASLTPRRLADSMLPYPMSAASLEDMPLAMERNSQMIAPLALASKSEETRPAAVSPSKPATEAAESVRLGNDIGEMMGTNARTQHQPKDGLPAMERSVRSQKTTEIEASTKVSLLPTAYTADQELPSQTSNQDQHRLPSSWTCAAETETHNGANVGCVPKLVSEDTRSVTADRTDERNLDVLATKDAPPPDFVSKSDSVPVVDNDQRQVQGSKMETDRSLLHRMLPNDHFFTGREIEGQAAPNTIDLRSAVASGVQLDETPGDASTPAGYPEAPDSAYDPTHVQAPSSRLTSPEKLRSPLDSYHEKRDKVHPSVKVLSQESGISRPQLPQGQEQPADNATSISGAQLRPDRPNQVVMNDQLLPVYRAGSPISDIAGSLDAADGVDETERLPTTTRVSPDHMTRPIDHSPMPYSSNDRNLGMLGPAQQNPAISNWLHQVESLPSWEASSASGTAHEIAVGQDSTSPERDLDDTSAVEAAERLNSPYQPPGLNGNTVDDSNPKPLKAATFKNRWLKMFGKTSTDDRVEGDRSLAPVESRIAMVDPVDDDDHRQTHAQSPHLFDSIAHETGASSLPHGPPYQRLEMHENENAAAADRESAQSPDLTLQPRGFSPIQTDNTRAEASAQAPVDEQDSRTHVDEIANRLSTTSLIEHGNEPVGRLDSPNPQLSSLDVERHPEIEGKFESSTSAVNEPYGAMGHMPRGDEARSPATTFIDSYFDDESRRQSVVDDRPHSRASAAHAVADNWGTRTNVRDMQESLDRYDSSSQTVGAHEPVVSPSQPVDHPSQNDVPARSSLRDNIWQTHPRGSQDEASSAQTSDALSHWEGDHAAVPSTPEAQNADATFPAQDIYEEYMDNDGVGSDPSSPLNRHNSGSAEPQDRDAATIHDTVASSRIETQRGDTGDTHAAATSPTTEDTSHEYSIPSPAGTPPPEYHEHDPAVLLATDDEPLHPAHAHDEESPVSGSVVPTEPEHAPISDHQGDYVDGAHPQSDHHDPIDEQVTISDNHPVYEEHDKDSDREAAIVGNADDSVNDEDAREIHGAAEPDTVKPVQDEVTDSPHRVDTAPVSEVSPPTDFVEQHEEGSFHAPEDNVQSIMDDSDPMQREEHVQVAGDRDLDNGIISESPAEAHGDALDDHHLDHFDQIQEPIMPEKDTEPPMNHYEVMSEEDKGHGYDEWSTQAPIAEEPVTMGASMEPETDRGIDYFEPLPEADHPHEEDDSFADELPIDDGKISHEPVWEDEPLETSADDMNVDREQEFVGEPVLEDEICSDDQHEPVCDEEGSFVEDDHEVSDGCGGPDEFEPYEDGDGDRELAEKSIEEEGDHNEAESAEKDLEDGDFGENDHEEGEAMPMDDSDQSAGDEILGDDEVHGEEYGEFPEPEDEGQDRDLDLIEEIQGPEMEGQREDQQDLEDSEDDEIEGSVVEDGSDFDPSDYDDEPFDDGDFGAQSQDEHDGSSDQRDIGASELGGEDEGNRELDMDQLYAGDIPSMPSSPTDSDYGRNGFASPLKEVFPTTTVSEEGAQGHESPVAGLSETPGEEQVEEAREPVRFSHLYRQSIDWQQALNSPTLQEFSDAVTSGQAEETAPEPPSSPSECHLQTLAALEKEQQTTSVEQASPLSPRPMVTPPPDYMHGIPDEGAAQSSLQKSFGDEGADPNHHHTFSPRLQPTPPPDSEFDRDGQYITSQTNPTNRYTTECSSRSATPSEEGEQSLRALSRGPRTFDEMGFSSRQPAPPRYEADENGEGSSRMENSGHTRGPSLSQRFSGWWRSGAGGGGPAGQRESRPPPPPVPYDSRYGEPEPHESFI